MKTILSISFLFDSILLMLSCGKGDNSTPVTPAKSSEKQITDFKFANLSPVVSATIDQTVRKIGASVPGSLSALMPTITFSSKATISPASGATQNFTSPVVYTVTAEDGSSQTYQVAITSTLAAKPLVPVSINDSLRIKSSQITGRDFTDPSKDSVILRANGGVKSFLSLQDVSEAKSASFTEIPAFSTSYPLYKLWYTEKETNSGYVLVFLYKKDQYARLSWVKSTNAKKKFVDGVLVNITGNEEFILYYGKNFE